MLATPQLIQAPPARPPGTIALGVAGLGVIMHLFAGWLDDGKIVLSPGGHLSLFVLYTWLLTVMLSIRPLVTSHGHATRAWLSLGISMLGLALLFTY